MKRFYVETIICVQMYNFYIGVCTISYNVYVILPNRFVVGFFRAYFSDPINIRRLFLQKSKRYIFQTVKVQSKIYTFFHTQIIQTNIYQIYTNIRILTHLRYNIQPSLVFHRPFQRYILSVSLSDFETLIYIT